MFSLGMSGISQAGLGSSYARISAASSGTKSRLSSYFKNYSGLYYWLLFDPARLTRTYIDSLFELVLQDTSTVEVQTLSVGPEYFQTMKIPLLQGRLLTQADTTTSGHALVNRKFVQKYISGRTPLGLHFGGDDPKDPQREIVGVVGDTKYDTLRRKDAPSVD
jgi:hypothetical protein